MRTTWDDAERERVRERLRELATRLPEVHTEDVHDHTGFFLRKKRFAWLMVDHHGDGRLALWVKAPPGEQEALVSMDADRYFVPAYLGPRGWVGIKLDEASSPDWDEVAALLDQAWRMVATQRAIAAYDAR
jgi:hypothetical protein